MGIKAYAAPAAGAPFEPFEYEPGPLGENQIEIAVQHCGICHSDVAMHRNEWGMTTYPFVPGHEAMGVVAQVGSAVRTLRPGQRVGMGWQSSSCSYCADCRRGDETFCVVANEGTIVGRPGGFGEAVRANARFAIPIPDGYASEHAGPLMCGGITVFTPFIDYNVRPTMKVGVIGIGGLGHMALQFARAMGMEVTAFSSSPGKEAEARSFGAHHFVATSNPDQMAAQARSYDFILNTVSADIDWLAFIGMLRPRGVLCIVGVPDNPMTIPVFPLIMSQLRIGGSPIGNPATIEKMFHFAAQFGVQPKIERFPLAEVNAAMQHTADYKARYRTVLDVAAA